MISKKDQTYKDLRYRIITHDLKPMAPLNEKALMDHYDLGRTPLREVLLQLQRDGLIQRYSRSGTIVSPVDIHIYKQNIDLMEKEAESVYRALLEAQRDPFRSERSERPFYDPFRSERPSMQQAPKRDPPCNRCPGGRL